jgi:hypothetical protein
VRAVVQTVSRASVTVGGDVVGAIADGLLVLVGVTHSPRAQPGSMDAQMGHQDGSVQARYSHITQAMTERLMGGLAAVRESALDQRAALAPGSPVAVLDRLLRERLQ